MLHGGDGSPEASTVVFAVALVCLAGAPSRFAGVMTLFGGAILTMVSLLEITFYFGTLFPEPPTMGLTSLALLFALAGVAFLAAGIAAFVAGWWRAAAAALLVATLAAYLFWLGTGREEPDLVGATTYVVELIALGVIWIAPEAPPAPVVPNRLTSARASAANPGYRGEPTQGGRP